MIRYELYGSLHPLYKWPILCKVDGVNVTPLVRLVPVAGENRADAIEMLKCITGVNVRIGGETYSEHEGEPWTP